MSQAVDAQQESFNKLLKNLDKMATSELLASKVLEVNPLEDHDCHFYQIDSLTHFSNEPQRQALENVYSSLRHAGANLLYLLKGEKTGVKIFLGVVRNKQERQLSLDLSIRHIADAILQPSFQGNFRGSHLSKITKPDEFDLEKYQHVGILQGSVGNQEQGENSFHQGIDRLIDVMFGQEYCLVVNAAALNTEELLDLEESIHHAYTALSAQAKFSVQQGINSSTSDTKGRNASFTEGKNDGSSSSETHGSNKGDSQSSSKGTSYTTNDDDTSEGSNESITKGTNSGTSFSKAETTTLGTSESNSWGSNESASNSKGDSLNVSTEVHNKKAQQWLNYIDETLLPRIDYARNRGGFNTCISFFTKSDNMLHTLGYTAVSLFSGNNSNNYPLTFYPVTRYPNICQNLKQFQIPKRNTGLIKNKNTQIVHALKSRLISHNAISLGTFYSPKELSLVAGLPQKEVAGLSIHEEISFGLNPPKVSKAQRLTLGKLVQDGREFVDNDVALDNQDLNKHIFIAGVTGSGKTTTCQHLLRQSKLPFLVIEPAKTEYRSLLHEYDDLIVFTPGKDELGTFRLNPLELLPNESISARVDVIKASFCAAFVMEAAIPQILEAALYRSYEKLGWDLSTSVHSVHSDPFAVGCYPFPVFQDLIIASTEVIEEQGFDQRLRDDYIGSIKARLQGLLVGAKKQIFNNLRSLDFSKLLHKRVIIELEEVRSADEKSLLMAFILINLVQALKNEHKKNLNFKHLTLVEEAHRLLSNPTMGDSQNKRQAVEMFTDMLAEIRKYGEGLIIVDQIPNKLSSEVLKNTNTKIIHKLFAQDDKEAIGNTMDLDKKQVSYLSRLNVGHAIVFSQGWQKAAQVKISSNSLNNETLLSSDVERIIKNRVAQCFLEQKQLIVAPENMGINTLSCIDYLNFSRSTKTVSLLNTYLNQPSDENRVKAIAEISKLQSVDFVNSEFLVEYLLHHLYIARKEEPIELWRKKLTQLLDAFNNNHEFNVCLSNLDNKTYRRVI